MQARVMAHFALSMIIRAGMPPHQLPIVLEGGVADGR
jgi:hypothetical protein